MLPGPRLASLRLRTTNMLTLVFIMPDGTFNISNCHLVSSSEQYQ
jgi:hypothetical protein